MPAQRLCTIEGYLKLFSTRQKTSIFVVYFIYLNIFYCQIYNQTQVLLSFKSILLSCLYKYVSTQ